MTKTRLLDVAMTRATGSRVRRATIISAALIGAGLVVASSVIHLHLWAGAYHSIPTIGPLFLVQGIAGIAIAVMLVLRPRLITVAAAAGFMIAAIAGLLLSVNVGLFGFMDSLDAPFARLSLVIESAGAAELVVVAAALLLGQHRQVDRRTPSTLGQLPAHAGATSR
jgi:hypothetical protein